MEPTIADQPGPSTGRTNWVRRNWKWCLPVAVLIGVVPFIRVSFHPGYIEDDRRETIQLIEEFHSRQNTEQFDQIYGDASVILTKSTSREEIVSAMQRTYSTFGKFRSANSSEINFVMGAPVQIRAVYNSIFEKGPTTELFVFVREGEKIRLASYRILPGDHSEILKSAEHGAREFYRRLSAGQYGEVWDSADVDFKNSTSRDQLIDILTSLNHRLGNCSEPELVAVDLADPEDKHFDGLIYHRKCDHSEVSERLAWRIANGNAFLRGYH